jgi:3-oxoacyl-[acyl-carrier protein] reductase
MTQDFTSSIATIRKPTTPITVVTGSRKGIGKALARHYCKKGHIVVGCSRKPVDWSEPGYHHYLADVSDEEAVMTMFGALRKEFGRIDNLVNNAGVASMNHTLLTPMSTVRAILETNVVGTFLFCREGARLMANSQRGRIVNFSTVAVPLKLNGEAMYAASKAAVVTLTSILAQELASMRITVNCVGPTPIDTDLIRTVPKVTIQSLVDRQAIRRRGSFDDVIHVVDFFLAEHSDFVTGQTIYLGGV